MSTQDKKQQFQFFDIDQIDDQKGEKGIKQSKVSDIINGTQLMQYSQSTVNVKNQSLQQSSNKTKLQQINITQSLQFSIKTPQQQSTLLKQTDSLSVPNNNRRGEGRRLIRRQNDNNKTQTSNQNTQKQLLKDELKTQNPIQQIKINLIKEVPINQTNFNCANNNDHLNDEQIRNLIDTGLIDNSHKNIEQNQQTKHDTIQININPTVAQQLTISQQRTPIKMTQSKVQLKKQNNNSSQLDNNNSNTTNPIDKFTKSQVMDNSTLKQSGHQNDIILGSKSSSVMLNSDMCKNYNKGNNNIEVIVQDKLKQNENKNSQGIKCSLLQMNLSPQVIETIKYSISQLATSSANSEWHSSLLPYSRGQFLSISPIRYYGFSETHILFSQNNNNQQKYNRQLLLGTKSKLKRQIIQQNNNQKISQNKSFFLYLENNLIPLTKTNITFKEQQHSDHVNFIHHLDFQHRLNIVIELLQIFTIIHNLSFTLFPHTLFPSQIQKSALYIKNNHTKSQFQPHLKLTVHFLQSYKQHIGNSTKIFDLKNFINSNLKIHQLKQPQKKYIDETKIKKQVKSQFLKDLKSPQIRFYHQEWYWKIWNQLLSQFTSHQQNKTYISDIITPTQIDLFQIPFSCLKFLYGNQFIQRLTQKRYDQIEKEIHKILTNQKLKKIENSDQQIIKICQKALIQWTEYEKMFKQEHEKFKKLDKPQKQINFKQKDYLSNIIKHQDSKKVFEQILSCLSIFPVHQMSQQKYERRRVFSLSILFQKLKKFRVVKKSKQIVPALIKLDNKLSQKGLQKDGNKKKNSTVQKGVTILSSQSTKHQIMDLKGKYFDLLRSTNNVKQQQFDNQFVKKQQTHLLTNQFKKKLNTVFSSHNGIMKTPKYYTLIYKSSVFNFAVKKFYELCENKSCLLYVMKIKNDRTLYYFNQQKIIKSRQLNGLFGGYIKDVKGTSFIYTGDQVLKVKNSSKSFGVSHLHGPIIGQGDIIIKQGNLQNECHHPKSYQPTKKSKKLLKSTKFELEQMDIYQVMF